MSENESFGFTKFVPGFDFLQNIAKGATQAIPQLPNLSNWVAPTLNVEELEKRIDELKAVHFWLDQNSKALGATIQALEVQKMTLATLRGMNFNMGELANALKLNADTMMGGVQKAVAGATGAAQPPAAKTAQTADAGTKPGGAEQAPKVIDPLQWWGALTQQFQQIAADAMKDAARNTDTARTMATGVAQEALKTASSIASAAAPQQSTARKAAAPPKGGTRSTGGRSTSKTSGKTATKTARKSVKGTGG